MNKKLPELFHGKNIISNNKKTYYSLNDKEITNYKKDEKNSSVEVENKFKNFSLFFNKNVLIKLKDGKEIRGKILSKIDKKILVTGGIYLDINDIDWVK